MLAPVKSKVVFKLPGIGIQDIVGSEWLISKGGIGRPVLQDIHQGKYTASAAPVIAVGSEPNLNVVCKFSTDDAVEFDDSGIEVVVDDVIGILEIQRKQVVASVAIKYPAVAGGDVAQRFKVVKPNAQAVVVVDIIVNFSQSFVALRSEGEVFIKSRIVIEFRLEEGGQLVQVRGQYPGDVVTRCAPVGYKRGRRVRPDLLFKIDKIK